MLSLDPVSVTSPRRRPASAPVCVLVFQRESAELAGRVNLTLANLSILKTNKARAVRFSTLETLCRELKCQPGDLLEYFDED